MVSFIRQEIKYFIRAGELSFLSPSDGTRGKGDNSSSPRVLCGRKIEAANSKQRAGWKQWNFTVLLRTLEKKQ